MDYPFLEESMLLPNLSECFEPPRIPKCPKLVRMPCDYRTLSQIEPPDAQEPITIKSIIKVDQDKYSLSLMDEQLRGELNITQQQFEEITKSLPLYLNGEAKITRSDGLIRQGSFKDGLLNGQGRIQQNKKKYSIQWQGQFVNGLIHGQGEIHEGNFSIAKGNFKNGQLNGLGEYSYLDGNTYAGLFKDGDITEGTILTQTGNIFEGQIQYCHLNGRGKYMAITGYVWEGIFKDSYLQGEGKQIYNGKILAGLFVDTELVRLDSITYADGQIHSGQFNDRKQLHGLGRIQLTNGSIVEGNFQYQNIGEAKLVLKNKVTYQGIFVQNKLIVKCIQGRKKQIIKIYRM